MTVVRVDPARGRKRGVQRTPEGGHLQLESQTVSAEETSEPTTEERAHKSTVDKRDGQVQTTGKKKACPGKTRKELMWPELRDEREAQNSSWFLIS